MNLNHIVSLSCYINILTRMTNGLGITTYYIDQFFNLYQPLLAFEAFEECHTDINLAKIILKVLHKYDITKKLYCITIDNTSNNYIMVHHLFSHLHEEDIEWDHWTQHIPCLAHIINMVVKEFLNNWNDNKEAVFIPDYFKEDSSHCQSNLIQSMQMGDF